MGTNKGSRDQKGLSRLTIDISKDAHKRLKAVAAFQGKSMRELINELITKEIYRKRVPNKETLEAITDVENEKGLVEAKDVDDLLDKLGL